MLIFINCANRFQTCAEMLLCEKLRTPKNINNTQHNNKHKMALETPGIVNKIIKPFKIIIIIILAVTLIISLYDGYGYYKKTGDYKPLLQASGGSIVSADYGIISSLRELEKQDISKEYATYLKKSIVNNIIFLLVFFIIVFSMVKFIFKVFGIQPDMMETMKKVMFYFVAFLITLAAMTILEYLAVKILYQQNIIPFYGVYKLIADYPVTKEIISNFGSYTIKTTIPHINMTLNGTVI